MRKSSERNVVITKFATTSYRVRVTIPCGHTLFRRKRRKTSLCKCSTVVKLWINIVVSFNKMKRPLIANIQCRTTYDNTNMLEHTHNIKTTLQQVPAYQRRVIRQIDVKNKTVIVSTGFYRNTIFSCKFHAFRMELFLNYRV